MSHRNLRFFPITVRRGTPAATPLVGALPRATCARPAVPGRFVAGIVSVAIIGLAGLLSEAPAVEPTDARHWPGQVASSAGLPVPAMQRAPFGWCLSTVTRADHTPLVLTWPGLPADVRPTRLRLAIGLDERDDKSMEVRLPESGRVLGHFELRTVSQFQVFELPLSDADVADVCREGVALRLRQGSDLEIITAGPDAPAALRPHLLVPGTADVMTEFHARLGSLASVQQFGWMEGCVLDGLLDLAERPAHAALRDVARQHLGLFIRDGRLVYESPVSAPSDGRVYGIEGGLPFAALARLEPRSPLFDLALEFWRSQRNASGAIQDGEALTSEGSYTIAYPMAEIARVCGSDELMREAVHQVRLRQTAFFDGKEFWRVVRGDGRRGNRNWARGIAWQMLGLARTVGVAKGRAETDDLTAAHRQMAEWIIRLQRNDGLWSVFVDEPALTPDTAGSAGIAAALALGAKHGWLDESARTAARRTLAGLQTHLTPDGFLGGVSQSNKGGEKIQRSDYRAIFQMGMGLMGQLMAALPEN